MIGALALYLQVAAAAPPPLVVRAGTHATTIPVVTTSNSRYIMASKLVTALNGKLRATNDGRYTITLGESRVDLTDGDPFVRVDSTVVPLTWAPLVIDGALYVPFQIVTEVIPRFITGFIYDPEASEMRGFNATPRRVVASSPHPPKTATAPIDTPSDDDVAPTPAPVQQARASSSTQTAPHKRPHHIVIVDAGHGGVDNGMTGPIGGGPKIYEKNITLAIAKLVVQDLRSEDVKVVMTRTRDTLIALSDRGRIANSSHGDVFISIHVNATGSRGSDAARERGYETYFLAEAKTEDARRVEKMENEAVRFETGANAPKGDPLSFILHDMAQNEHLRESDELAQFVQDGFHAFHPGPDRGVQQANFAVLRGSYMPAVLIEIGFGTNAKEAAFISDVDNQRTIAHSITKSIMKYLDRYEARVGTGATP